MRHRPLADSEPALAVIEDPAPPPGRAVTVDAELLDLGVAPARLDDARRLVAREGYRTGGELIRALLRELSGTPAGKALQRVVLGDDGRSLSDDAAEVGTSKQALAVAEKRVAQRVRKIAG